MRELFEDHYDADVSLQPECASARYKLALCAAVAREMRTVADAAGTKLLFLVVPSRLDVCEGFDLGWIDPQRWPDWERGRLPAAIAAVVRATGVAYLDLYQAFRAGGACELFFRGGDSHWNEQGQALAARLAAGRIRGEAWLE